MKQRGTPHLFVSRAARLVATTIGDCDPKQQAIQDDAKQHFESIIEAQILHVVIRRFTALRICVDNLSLPSTRAIVANIVLSPLPQRNGRK